MRRKPSEIDRRTALGGSAGGAVGLDLPACKKSSETRGSAGGSTIADTGGVRIGYVSPQTGPLATFTAADELKAIG